MAGLTSWTTAPLCVGHARVRPGDVKLFLRDLFGDFPISQKRVGFGLIALLSIPVTFFGWAERWLADPIVAVDSLFRLDEVGYESFCPFRSRSAGPPKSARKKSLGDRPMG